MKKKKVLGYKKLSLNYFTFNTDEITMNNSIKYTIGILFIILGVFIKTLFNHNMEYWGTIKVLTIFIFILGLFICFIPFWEKFDKKPKISFSKGISQWVLWYSKNTLMLLSLLGLIILLENIGENLNYKLRGYYLSNDTIITNGIIVGVKTINTVKMGFEEFYVVDFVYNNKKVQKGIMLEYSLKDINGNVDFVSLNNNSISVKRLGKMDTKILHSRKYPSFLKIIE